MSAFGGKADIYEPYSAPFFGSDKKYVPQRSDGFDKQKMWLLDVINELKFVLSVLLFIILMYGNM